MLETSLIEVFYGLYLICEDRGQLLKVMDMVGAHDKHMTQSSSLGITNFLNGLHEPFESR
jgi:hypothetical protein